MKVIGSYLELVGVTVANNQLFQSHGGVHLMYSKLEVSDSLFSTSEDDSFFTTLVSDTVGDTL